MNYEEQLKQTNETNHFMIHNNIKAAMLTKDQARVTAAVTPASLNAMESVHGGLMFIMAEIAAGLLTRNDGRRHVTVNSSFRFLKDCGGGRDKQGQETLRLPFRCQGDGQ